VPAPPVNGRVWLTEAALARNFKQPEDVDQMADLDGELIHLAACAAVVMRRYGSRPDMTDEELSERMNGMPIEWLQRAQRVLEEVEQDHSLG
jgi:hypothetical protein